MKALVSVVALACFAALPAAAQNITVTGLDGRERAFTQQQLAAFPQQRLTLKSRDGVSHIYEGPALTTLLTAVGAPSGEALRGQDMADVVLVSASDGYRVALSLAETDASLRGDKVILADLEDGKPLDASQGPLRLVVDGDARPARSARLVTGVRLVRLTDGSPR